MDAQTVDAEYAQLEQQGQQTAQLMQGLAVKLQAAATAGDPNAREWMLDLKEVALAVKAEEDRTTNLLGQIHTMVSTEQQVAPVYQPQPQFQQPSNQPRYQQPAGGGGGMMQRFLGGGFGRAIAGGAGFGIGDDLINKIF